MTTAVRLARVEDARAIAAVHVAGWQGGYQGILPADFLAGLSVETRAARHLARIAEPRHPLDRTWVAELDGAVLGFAIAGRSRDDDAPTAGEVYAIYVRPDTWRRGLGAALMERAMAELAGQGFDSVVLWVLAENARSHRFYERMGFETDGSRKQIELGGRAVDEIRYRRPLP